MENEKINQEASVDAKNEVINEDQQENAVNEKPVEDQPKQKENEIKEEELTTLEERAIAGLSYFSFLAIIPFYLKKESKFCRHHGKQGLILAIIFFLANFFTVIDFVYDIVIIIQVIIALWAGYLALSGRWSKVPFIYKWADELEKAITIKEKPTNKETEN